MYSMYLRSRHYKETKLILAMHRDAVGTPEAMQPAINSSKDLHVSLCHMPIIKGISNHSWKLLIAADANHNLTIGF